MGALSLSNTSRRSSELGSAKCRPYVESVSTVGRMVDHRYARRNSSLRTTPDRFVAPRVSDLNGPVSD
jgi:hypothetical protein